MENQNEDPVVFRCCAGGEEVFCIRASGKMDFPNSQGMSYVETQLITERDRMFDECRKGEARTYTTHTPELLGFSSALIGAYRLENERLKDVNEEQATALREWLTRNGSDMIPTNPYRDFGDDTLNKVGSYMTMAFFAGVWGALILGLCLIIVNVSKMLYEAVM